MSLSRYYAQCCKGLKASESKLTIQALFSNVGEITINMEGMQNHEQRKNFMNSFTEMLEPSQTISNATVTLG